MQRKQLTTYLDTLLEVKQYKDYAPNGLQVQGSDIIQKIVTGVTASQALIDSAIQKKADAILVHHGYFWKGESEAIIGMKYARIKSLIEHDINLLAYHLPLDGHSELGNNAQLGKVLGVPVIGELEMNMIPSVGLVGELEEPITGDQLALRIESALDRKPLHIDVNKPIKRIAWVTGGAQDYIEDAAQAGCDAFISGEISERTTHSARELGIHYFAAGHHATERYGVKALGEHLALQFGLQCDFVDVSNPA